MDALEKRNRIYTAMFIMSNRLQVLGDSFDEEITLKQWLLISTIRKSRESYMSLSDAANLIGNSRQNVKKMALILQKQGYMDLGKDKSDDRKICIFLTKKCLDYYTQRLAAEKAFVAKLFNGMDDKNIDELFASLRKMAYNVGVMEYEYEQKLKS